MVASITPGELLRDEFLVPMGISQYRLAKETGIPAQRIGQIVLGRRSVTADTDLRLCRFFGLSDGYWLRAQAAYDIEVARRKLEPELRSPRHEDSAKHHLAPFVVAQRGGLLSSGMQRKNNPTAHPGPLGR